MQQLIYVNNLSYAVNQTEILCDISMHLDSGEFVGIIGPNGSGKTTLLNCLCGLLPSMQGTVVLNKRSILDYKTRDIAQNIAYLHQETPENLNLNVAQVVELGLIPRLSLFASIEESQRNEVNAAIDQVGLTSKRQQSFDSLSGGEKQRCLLAKVIVQQPLILLMDEPTNHLDIHYQVEIMSLVRRLGISVIASFHDLNLAAAYCDRLLCLNKGEIACQGNAHDVLQKETLEEIFKVPVAVDLNPLNQKQRISFNLWSKDNEAS